MRLATQRQENIFVAWKQFWPGAFPGITNMVLEGGRTHNTYTAGLKPRSTIYESSTMAAKQCIHDWLLTEMFHRRLTPTYTLFQFLFSKPSYPQLLRVRNIHKTKLVGIVRASSYWPNDQPTVIKHWRDYHKRLTCSKLRKSTPYYHHYY